MVILFGRKSVGKTINQGQFMCPKCKCERIYALKSYRNYFSLFLIPLIPLNHVGETVQCTACGTSYVPGSVLSNKQETPQYQVAGTANRTQIAHNSFIASSGKRLGAFLVDMILLTFLNFPLAILIGSLPKSMNHQLDGKFQYLFITLWILYFFLFEVFTKGSTVGKKLLSIKTVSEKDNNYISTGAAFIRAVIKVIPFIQIVLLFTDKNKAIHDFAAGSIVVEKV